MTDSLSTSRRADFEPRREAIRAALERAIAERGLRHFAIVDTVGEGRIFPNGLEERSGDVMDDCGRIWFFWTAWDPVREQVVIGHWEEVDVGPSLTTSPGYVRARRELGLDKGDARA